MNNSQEKLKPQLKVPEIKYEVVNSYPHDPEAFTEGLEFHDGFLYESTGGDKLHLPPSSLRRVDLKTGRILDNILVDEKYFAEGLTIFGGRVFQLTDKSHVALVYELPHLNQTRDQLKYKNWDRGWGLTHDDKYLILSDSTEQIHFIDPRRFQIVRTIQVNDGGTHVADLNELEYVNGFIYANLYPTDLVLQIHPQNGKILGQLDLSGLRPPEIISCRICVPNGLAHDEKTGHLLVTGKRWSRVFEIRLTG